MEVLLVNTVLFAAIPVMRILSTLASSRASRLPISIMVRMWNQRSLVTVGLFCVDEIAIFSAHELICAIGFRIEAGCNQSSHYLPASPAAWNLHPYKRSKVQKMWGTPAAKRSLASLPYLHLSMRKYSRQTSSVEPSNQ
jgi:hypothetical protein